MPTIVRQLLFTPSSFNRRTDHQFVNEASMIADASFFFPGFFFFFWVGVAKLLLGTKHHQFSHFRSPLNIMKSMICQSRTVITIPFKENLESWHSVPHTMKHYKP